MSRWGAKVAGYALNPPTQPNLFEIAGVSDHVDSTIADIRDLDTFTDTLRRVKPEIVLHLAAQPLVLEALRAPLATIDVNVMGTAIVLEALREAGEGVESVVLVTSDKVYRDQETPRPYIESDRLGGHEAYGASKACAEIVAEAYDRHLRAAGRDFGLATIRGGNVIGGGDWAADRLVPDAIRAFSDGQPLRLRVPNATRPWQHVLELVAGIRATAERAAADRRWIGGWNFGPRAEDCWPVARVAAALVKQWGDGASWEADPQSDQVAHEAAFLSISSAKAEAELGWRSRWELDETLAATAAWYRAHHDGTDMKDVTAAQLEAYFNV